MLGFGVDGESGTNAAFDELRTWTFLASVPLEDIEDKIFDRPPADQETRLDAPAKPGGENSTAFDKTGGSQ